MTNSSSILRLTAGITLLALLAGCGFLESDQEVDREQPLTPQLTADDRTLADSTKQKALETALSNTTITWRNTRTGHSGSVTPKQSYRLRGGTYCRTYHETISVGNRTELFERTACRVGEGVWKVANPGSPSTGLSTTNFGEQRVR